jgi:hypothetical protein
VRAAHKISRPWWTGLPSPQRPSLITLTDGMIWQFKVQLALAPLAGLIRDLEPALVGLVPPVLGLPTLPSSQFLKEQGPWCASPVPVPAGPPIPLPDGLEAFNLRPYSQRDSDVFGDYQGDSLFIRNPTTRAPGSW